MLSAAFAMFVCGCLSVFVPREKFPSIAETLTMCFSSVRSRSMSGLSLLQRMNGATALTSCTSSSSGGRHVGERQPPAVHRAQIDLLQIGVELARREDARQSERRVVVRARDLRQRGRTRGCPMPGAAAVPRHEAARRSVAPLERRALRCGERALARLVSPRGAAARRVGQLVAAARLELEQVRVEPGRAAHGLAALLMRMSRRVVRLVAGSARRSRRSASGAGRGRGLRGGRPSPRSRARARSAARRRAGSASSTITRAPARSSIERGLVADLDRAPVMSATRPVERAVWKRFGVVELGARRGTSRRRRSAARVNSALQT